MKAVLAVLLAASTVSALAQSTYVRPHVRKDGTYVEGHYRTAPNNTRIDNYSTQGNMNPYTGQQGTVNPWVQPAPQPQVPSNPFGEGNPFRGANPYGPKF
jgi:hypothetical protein